MLKAFLDIVSHGKWLYELSDKKKKKKLNNTIVTCAEGPQW